MAEHIASASGTAYGLIVNDDGTITARVQAVSGTGAGNIGYFASGGQNWLNVRVDRVGAGGGAGTDIFIVSGNTLPVSGPNQIYGMGSGTTAWNPIMVESGTAGTPQRAVVAATLSATNVYVQSGVAWTGVGSVLVTGSVNIAGTPSVNAFVVSGNSWAGVGSVFNAGGSVNATVLGSVAITNSPAVTGSVAITTSPVPVSGNSLGIYGATGSPTLTFLPIAVASGVAGLPRNALIDAFVVSGNAWAGVGSVFGAGGSFNVTALGSVAITNTPSVNAFVVSGNNWAGVGSVFLANGSANVIAGGDIAHDAADAGNPLKIGGQARQTNPTAVADADRTYAMFDDVGRQVITPFHVRDLVTQQTTTISNTTETTILGSGAASVFHDLVMLKLSNTSATAVRADIRDVTAGTVVDSWYIPAGTTVGATYTKELKQTTANSHWTAQLSASVTDVRIFAQGVKNV